MKRLAYSRPNLMSYNMEKKLLLENIPFTHLLKNSLPPMENKFQYTVPWPTSQLKLAHSFAPYFFEFHLCWSYKPSCFCHFSDFNTVCNLSSPMCVTCPTHDIFFYDSTALGGLGLLIVEFLRSHSDTRHSVGHLLTSDRPVAETFTWQHTTLTRDRHPCPRRDSNPQSQQESGLRPEP